MQAKPATCRVPRGRYDEPGFEIFRARFNFIPPRQGGVARIEYFSSPVAVRRANRPHRAKETAAGFAYFSGSPICLGSHLASLTHV